MEILEMAVVRTGLKALMEGTPTLPRIAVS
jgi:hypothetical protein